MIIDNDSNLENKDNFSYNNLKEVASGVGAFYDKNSSNIFFDNNSSNFLHEKNMFNIDGNNNSSVNDKYYINKNIDIQINEVKDKTKKNYKLINSSKKIFYFSKFSLEFDLCYKIIKFTKTLKENLLKVVLDPIRHFVKSKYKKEL